MRAVETIRYVRVLILSANVLAGVSHVAAQDAIRGRTANPHGNLRMACENCHTTTAWKPIRREPEFNHTAQTRFPLLGQHQNVACQRCHTNLVFAKTPSRCADCHADLHRRQFGSNCESCHTVLGWSVAVAAIQQHNNRFPLIGAHATATCDSCHHGAAAGVYTGLSTQCASCHLPDYQKAAAVNHVAAGISTTCETCHNVNTWQNARFDHTALTKFALTGAHAGIACLRCHEGNRFAGTPADCFGCHATDFTKAQNPNHVTAGFPQSCSFCHTTQAWQPASFNHDTFTRFSLTGAHATVSCAQCHVGGKFAGTPTACSGCHMPDFGRTTNPNHRTSNFPTTCETCHTTSSWLNATFDHSKSRFPLTGVHVNVPCAQCHQNGVFTGTPTACVGCHLPDFQKTTNPNHVAAGFPQDCSVCHTTAQWGGAKFDHTSTGFALTGAHTSVQCAQCHTNGNYSLTSGACVGCHLKDFNGANNPPHASAGFPQDCALCHSTTNWTSATFNHSTTGFTLTGAHVSALCSQCHVNNNYTLTTGACWNCHQTDYNKAMDPPHKPENFPQDCSGCHTTANWNGAKFNHATTGFTLVGVHATTSCGSCHVGSNFSLTSASCWNCHQTDYNNANNPPHKSAGFPQDCTLCHGSSALTWTSATFNHTTTGFALTGAHVSLQCAQCHINNNYSLTSGACWNCHQTDYNGATNPPHKASNFPQDCSGCHTTTNWDSATFNHTATGFALAGVHATTSCTSCHVNNNYSLTSAACWNCHQTDYNKTNNPPHKAAGFPQDCTLCHGSSATNWTSATFNHTTTGFALVGVHATTSCSACHVSNNYTLTSAACWNCHQTDYNNTNNPPHKSAGFPQDCTLCHGSSATNWTSATFNHTTTGFALTGAHISLQCAQCHVNNNYTLTSGACWNCHQTDYNNTTNPPHKASNFPQDCSQCHTTTNWDGATFNHTSTGFALVGVHATTACSACHVNNNYGLTSGTCWNCHQTDYNNTTNPPHKAAGFPQDCTMCHGSSAVNWTSATFNHTTTGFALTGAHTTLQCAQCHINNNYSLTSGACWNCHQTDYNNTNNPPHKAAGFPQDCSQCHTTTNWDGTTFNHTTTGFALVGVHATTACNACHVNNNYGLSSAVCWNCHQTDYNNTTNPPHKAAGFPQDCTTCHGTSALNWTSATFNHSTTGFTLTGAHVNLQCNQCHVNNNYSLTSTTVL